MSEREPHVTRNSHLAEGDVPAADEARLVEFLEWRANSLASRTDGPDAVARLIAGRTGSSGMRLPATMHVVWIALLLALLIGLAVASIFIGRNRPNEVVTGGQCSLTGRLWDSGRGGTLSGSGFPPDAPVVLTFSRANGEVVGVMTEADFSQLRTTGSGRFGLSLRPSPEDVGTQLVSATAGDCTATVEVVADSSLFPPPCVVTDDEVESRADTSYAAAVRADDPMAYWRFEEEPGAEIARDEAGERDGTFGGSPRLAQPGAFAGSRSVYLDGLDVLRVPLLRFGRDFALEGWYFACGQAIDSQDAFAGRNGPGPDINFHDERLRIYDGRRDLVVAHTPLQRGAWNHVAVVRQDDLMFVYLDGQEVGFGEAPPEWVISAVGAGNAGRLEGHLDEIAVYDHELSADRVAAHFDAARSP